MKKFTVVDFAVLICLYCVGFLTIEACGTHLNSADSARIVTIVDLSESIQKDVPDSGVVRIKVQALICDTVALEKSAGIVSPDAGTSATGGFQCPKAQ